MSDPGLTALIDAFGTRYAIAKALKLSPSSVLRWKTIPTRRILEIEKISGIPRERLRPDLYRH